MGMNQPKETAGAIQFDPLPMQLSQMGQLECLCDAMPGIGAQIIGGAADQPAGAELQIVHEGFRGQNGNVQGSAQLLQLPLFAIGQRFFKPPIA